MPKKDYYALNDIPKQFDILLPTIKKLIDQKKITPVFKLPPTRLVIGGLDKDRFFVGYGTAVYEGLISIQRSQFSELWQNNKVEANFLILLNAQNIAEYSEEKPLDFRFPNDLIKSWQSTPLADITRNRALAVCLPSRTTFNWPNECTLENLEPEVDFDDPFSPDDNPFLDYLWLENTKLKLVLSETYISHSDLLASGAIKQNTTHDKLPDTITSPKLPILKYANPFHALIAKILQKHPELTVKQLFRVLALEARTEIDERKYDADNILADEVEGVLLWNDVTRKTGISKCSYSTLKNPVRDVKIAMKEQKV